MPTDPSVPLQSASLACSGGAGPLGIELETAQPTTPAKVVTSMPAMVILQKVPHSPLRTRRGTPTPTIGTAEINTAPPTATVQARTPGKLPSPWTNRAIRSETPLAALARGTFISESFSVARLECGEMLISIRHSLSG